MASIRDILANNLKENRKRLGFSQAKLAERADTSTQYIAMIEVSRKFPTPEMLERIANALEIETYELFLVKPSAEDAMERLHDAIVENIERVITKAVDKAIGDKCKK
jgi:transcriptional regulator with XRE-family HTH domain